MKRSNLLNLLGIGLAGAGVYALTHLTPSFSESPSLEGNKESYKTSDFKDDSDEVLLARMLFGEARNCSKDEKIAIAFTALNRNKDGKKWNGEGNIKDVLLCKWQYSCFNSNDHNRAKLMDPETYDRVSFEACLDVARNVLNGNYKNPMDGATHYHTKNVSPRWKNSPKMTFLGQMGKHIFYRED